MNDERKELIIMGVNIGTYTGWDDMDVAVLFFYDFEPREGVNLPAGGINVDFNTGIVEVYTDDVEGSVPFNLLEILKNIA